MAKLKVKYLALFNQLKTKYLSIDLVEKVDYDEIYQKQKINILLLLIIIGSPVIHLMQRYHKKIVNASNLNQKIKTLATKEKIKALPTKANLKAE